MKSTINQLREVSSGMQGIEEKFFVTEQKNKELLDENVKLKIEIDSMKLNLNKNDTSSTDRSRLLERIDELYSEMCKAKEAATKATDDVNSLKNDKEQLQILIEGLRGKLRDAQDEISMQKNNMNGAEIQWNQHKEDMMKEVEDLKAHVAVDSDSLIKAKTLEIVQLRSALTDLQRGLEEAEEANVDTKSAIVKELQDQYSTRIKENEEELQQLRKNNADLMARIDVLLSERNSSGCGSEEELQLMKEEIVELREVIARKSKALEIAEKQKEELDFANRSVERLMREKKELITRLKAKTDGAEVLSSRVNALRDEINEKQREVTQLQHAKKSYEVVKEKLKEENDSLVTSLNNVRHEFSAFKADMDLKIREKDKRIAHLLEQANSDQRRILVLDTDLTIAHKDLEIYKNTVTSMAKAQDEAQTLASQENRTKERLETVVEELSAMKKAKEKVEADLIVKDKMLKKAMDAVTKLETTASSSQWAKEKAKMSHQIEDLQRQVRDATEALEHRQASSSSAYKSGEERKRLLEENSILRQQLKEAAMTGMNNKEGNVEEITKLHQHIQENQKEMDTLKEKVRRYRMQKVNGIQYVDELKEKIAKGERELQNAKRIEASLTEELQRTKRAKIELEKLCKENQVPKSLQNDAASKKKIEERKPLHEEPECKQQ